METIRLTVTSEEAGQRADSLLARRLEGLTRSAAARLLEEGRVTDRGRPAAKNLRVQPGQVLEVQLPAQHNGRIDQRDQRAQAHGHIGQHRSQPHLIHLQGSTLFLHIRVIIPGFPGYVKSPSSEFMKMSQTGAG